MIAVQEAAKAARLGKQLQSGGAGSKKRKSALEEIREEEEQRKKRRMMSHPSSVTSSMTSSSTSSASKSKTTVTAEKVSSKSWLLKGIVVKVVDKNSDLYKCKCTVEEVADRGQTALLRPPEGGELVPVSDSDLETVIPAIGRSVLILKGEHRGLEAILEKLNVEAFSVNVTVVKNLKTLKRVPYEDVSKMVAKK